MCEYIPLDSIDRIPDGVVVYCKFDGATYDRAYHVDGKWFLAWDDREMLAPIAIQIRKGLYDKGE